jgi:hypothetical protein
MRKKYNCGKNMFKICKKTGISIICNRKEFNTRITVFAEHIKKYIKSGPPEKAVTIDFLYYD